jgi:hypothetical protein
MKNRLDGLPDHGDSARLDGPNSDYLVRETEWTRNIQAAWPLRIQNLEPTARFEPANPLLTNQAAIEFGLRFSPSMYS